MVRFFPGAFTNGLDESLISWEVATVALLTKVAFSRFLAWTESYVGFPQQTPLTWENQSNSLCHDKLLPEVDASQVIKSTGLIYLCICVGFWFWGVFVVCVCFTEHFLLGFHRGLQTYIDHAIIAFTRRRAPKRETWALQGKSAIDWLHPAISNHALERPDVVGSRPAHVHCFLSPKESFEQFSVFFVCFPSFFYDVRQWLVMISQYYSVVFVSFRAMIIHTVKVLNYGWSLHNLPDFFLRHNSQGTNPFSYRFPSGIAGNTHHTRPQKKHLDCRWLIMLKSHSSSRSLKTSKRFLCWGVQSLGNPHVGTRCHAMEAAWVLLWCSVWWSPSCYGMQEIVASLAAIVAICMGDRCKWMRWRPGLWSIDVISGSLGEIEGTWSCVKDHEIPLKVWYMV